MKCWERNCGVKMPRREFVGIKFKGEKKGTTNLGEKYKNNNFRK